MWSRCCIGGGSIRGRKHSVLHILHRLIVTARGTKQQHANNAINYMTQAFICLLQYPQTLSSLPPRGSLRKF